MEMSVFLLENTRLFFVAIAMPAWYLVPRDAVACGRTLVVF